MLALLRRTAARALEGSSAESDNCLRVGDETLLSVNVEDLRELLPPLPDIAWNRVAEVYARTVTPVYTAVRRTLHNDVEHLAQLFVELEPPTTDDDLEEPPSEPEELFLSEVQSEECSNFSFVKAAVIERNARRRKSSVSADWENPLMFTSSDPSIPSIIITPCPVQPRDRSCWIPYQDASFGNRLTVPSHPVINNVFPPLVAKSFPHVEHWRFVDGHWWALLPTPEEQMRKGMFSRPCFARKRKSCVDARSKYPKASMQMPSGSRAASNSSP